MDASTVNTYLAAHASEFPVMSYQLVQTRLLEMDQTRYNFLLGAYMKSPVLAFVFSFFLGWFGVDRFYIGDILAGVLKLITCGGLGLWWLIDLFLIIPATRNKNLQTLLTI